MVNVLRFLFLSFAVLNPFCASAQDTISPVERRLIIYTEILGHNYYGFSSQKETGLLSLNFAYRQALYNSNVYAMLSTGWGIFKTKTYTQAPSQPPVYADNWVSFIPVEATLQAGHKHHFLELGYGITMAFGNHNFNYIRAGSGGPSNDTTLIRNKGLQFIPRIGYSYYGKKGLMIRIAFTPHYFPKSYKKYEGFFLDKPSWISAGVSLGWSF